MTTEEKIAVMQAFANGKLIEYRIKPSYEWIPYLATGELSWNWWDNDYRIKQEPEYIPFDFTDAENLIGKTIKSKAGSFHIITSVKEKLVGIGLTNEYTYDYLFLQFTFLDGSICGKLKQ